MHIHLYVLYLHVNAYLLVNLVDVLEIIGARLLECLQCLVEEQLEIFECVLAEWIAPQACARLTTQSCT